MRSNWRGFYISSSIFFEILNTRLNYRSIISRKKRRSLEVKDLKKARLQFNINHRLHNLRNSTIVKKMLPFSFEIYNGVLGHVTSKVRKKGKEMNKFKTLKTVSLGKSTLGHKLGEFTLNRNFVKHTIKKKKK